MSGAKAWSGLTSKTDAAPREASKAYTRAAESQLSWQRKAGRCHLGRHRQDARRDPGVRFWGDLPERVYLAPAGAPPPLTSGQSVGHGRREPRRMTSRGHAALGAGLETTTKPMFRARRQGRCHGNAQTRGIAVFRTCFWCVPQDTRINWRIWGHLWVRRGCRQRAATPCADDPARFPRVVQGYTRRGMDICWVLQDRPPLRPNRAKCSKRARYPKKTALLAHTTKASVRNGGLGSFCRYSCPLKARA